MSRRIKQLLLCLAAAAAMTVSGTVYAEDTTENTAADTAAEEEKPAEKAKRTETKEKAELSAEDAEKYLDKIGSADGFDVYHKDKDFDDALWEKAGGKHAKKKDYTEEQQLLADKIASLKKLGELVIIDKKTGNAAASFKSGSKCSDDPAFTIPDVVSNTAPCGLRTDGLKLVLQREKRFEVEAMSTSNQSGLARYARVRSRAEEDSIYTGAFVGISPDSRPRCISKSTRCVRSSANAGTHAIPPERTALPTSTRNLAYSAAVSAVLPREESPYVDSMKSASTLRAGSISFTKWERSVPRSPENASVVVPSPRYTAAAPGMCFTGRKVTEIGPISRFSPNGTVLTCHIKSSTSRSRQNWHA